ncbi:MAG: type IV pilin protein [Actinomycetota bacterium]
MAEPVRWQDQWWHQQPDGSWLRFNEQTQNWEPYTYPAAPSGGMGGGAKAAIIAVVTVGVIFVLAILAAIAIPVFLAQREEGWSAQIEATLKNAATAQESHCIDAPECYTTSVVELQNEGLALESGINLIVVRADRQGYCMEASHVELPDQVWSYDSELANVTEGPCL